MSPTETVTRSGEVRAALWVLLLTGPATRNFWLVSALRRSVSTFPPPRGSHPPHVLVWDFSFLSFPIVATLFVFLFEFSQTSHLSHSHHWTSEIGDSNSYNNGINSPLITHNVVVAGAVHNLLDGFHDHSPYASGNNRFTGVCCRRSCRQQQCGCQRVTYISPRVASVRVRTPCPTVVFTPTVGFTRTKCMSTRSPGATWGFASSLSPDLIILWQMPRALSSYYDVELYQYRTVEYHLPRDRGTHPDFPHAY
jgi:hypothetical protein